MLRSSNAGCGRSLTNGCDYVQGYISQYASMVKSGKHAYKIAAPVTGSA